jgi:hypothetical protein
MQSKPTAGWHLGCGPRLLTVRSNALLGLTLCLADPSRSQTVRTIIGWLDGRYSSGCDLADQLSGSYPNSRSSCEQRQDLAIFTAHAIAALRDGSSKTQKPPLNSLVCG